MKYLQEVVTSIRSDVYNSFNNGYTSQSGHRWIAQADPLIWVGLGQSHDLHTYARSATITSTKQNSRTTVVDRPSIFDGLQLFFNTVAGIPANPPEGDWKPFTRISRRGVINLELTSRTFGQLVTGGGTWTVNGSIVNRSVNCFRLPNLLYLVTFDQLAEFAELIISLYGTDPAFQRIISNRLYSTKYWNLTVSQDAISFLRSTTYWWSPYTAKDGWRTFLEPIRIERSKSENYQYVLSGLTGQGILVDNNIPIATGSYAVSCDGLTARIRQTIDHLTVIEPSDSRTVLQARPVLFYTQQQALIKAMGEISRNFEGLFESPGFPELILGFLVKPKLDFKNPGKLILNLISGISSAYVAWNLAVQPGAEFISTALTGLQQAVQAKYESSVVFSSETHELTDLETGLQAYILDGLDPSTVIRWNATFHTELRIKKSSNFIADVFDLYMSDAYKSRRSGFVPSLTNLWQLQKFTFVADMFINMSALMSAAEAYFQSFGTRFSTVGHSVSIEVWLNTGEIKNFYVRSNNTTILLHPPAGGVWIQPPGPSPILIPIAIATALGSAR